MSWSYFCEGGVFWIASFICLCWPTYMHHNGWRHWGHSCQQREHLSFGSSVLCSYARALGHWIPVNQCKSTGVLRKYHHRSHLIWKYHHTSHLTARLTALFCSWNFPLSWQAAKIISIVLLPRLKPHWQGSREMPQYWQELDHQLYVHTITAISLKQNWHVSRQWVHIPHCVKCNNKAW